MRLLVLGQALREPAFLAHGANQRDQFDHHQRRGEAAQRIGAVEPPGDEQEGQPRDEPKEEAEEVLPSALGQRGEVFVWLFFAHPAASCSARNGRASSAVTTSPGASPLRRS